MIDGEVMCDRFVCYLLFDMVKVVIYVISVGCVWFIGRMESLEKYGNWFKICLYFVEVIVVFWWW